MNKFTLGIVAAILSTSANADWTFRDLHSSESYPFSNALAINDLNQVVGSQTHRIPNTVYNVSHIPTLWDGSTGSTTSLTSIVKHVEGVAKDINNEGQILAFTHYLTLGKYEISLFENGNNRVLPIPGSGSGSYPNMEINNNGEVIANSSLDPEIGSIHTENLYWDSSGNPQSLPNIVNGLNDKGQMVGQATFNGEKHAALFDGVDTIDIGTGYDWTSSSMAIDINNQGQIIATGFANIDLYPGSRSFLWDNGVVRSLQSTGDYPSSAISLNDFGIVVGRQWVDHVQGTSQALQTIAVIWDGHNQFDLNSFLDQDTKDAGWILITANDINNKGWVVGEAYNTLTFERHAYVLSTDEMLSPIPEPSTYLMMLAGLSLLGFMRYKST